MAFYNSINIWLIPLSQLEGPFFLSHTKALSQHCLPLWVFFFGRPGPFQNNHRTSELHLGHIAAFFYVSTQLVSTVILHLTCRAIIRDCGDKELFAPPVSTHDAGVATWGRTVCADTQAQLSHPTDLHLHTMPRTTIFLAWHFTDTLTQNETMKWSQISNSPPVPPLS